MEKTDPKNGVAQLPAKCCGRCIHGREIFDNVQLRRLIQCRALPGVPVIVNVNGSPMIQTISPTNDPSWDCDLFAPGTPVPANDPSMKSA